MATIYRVRRNIFGKCILQEWVRYPDVLGAPNPGWEDVDWDQAPLGLMETKPQPPEIS